LARAKDNLTQILQDYIDEDELPLAEDKVLSNAGLVRFVREILALEKQLAQSESPKQTMSMDDAYDFLAERYNLDKAKLTVDETLQFPA